jgi:argininosuccinate lyase
MAFTESLSFDKRLWIYDLRGSRIHVAGLHRANLVTDEELATLNSAFDQVEKELASGVFVFEPTDEDIHTALERRVTELAGDAGAKLHSGRSRNDQIATDLRLYVRAQLAEVLDAVIGMLELLAELAEGAGDAVMPGYTHTQRAQPVPVGHWLLAHAWALKRDCDRLIEAYHTTNVSPLGAGALAGSTLGLDPRFTAKELGFEQVFTNSFDAVSDRDFVAETLFAVALLAVHLSRLSEEIVLFTTEEYGFIRLDDAFATGSSMLPQKKNADIAELMRGKTGRFIGNLVALLTALKGLPLTYNRDLQEDKEPLFDSVDQIKLALNAIGGMLATMTFDYDRMRQAASSEYMQAVDVAEYLVKKGMPFRRAHSVAAGLVRDSLERRVPLSELVAVHPQLGEEAVALISADAAVRRRNTSGAASLESVATQLKQLRSEIAALSDARDAFER